MKCNRLNPTYLWNLGNLTGRDTCTIVYYITDSSTLSPSLRLLLHLHIPPSLPTSLRVSTRASNLGSPVRPNLPQILEQRRGVIQSGEMAAEVVICLIIARKGVSTCTIQTSLGQKSLPLRSKDSLKDQWSQRGNIKIGQHVWGKEKKRKEKKKMEKKKLTPIANKIPHLPNLGRRPEPNVILERTKEQRRVRRGARVLGAEPAGVAGVDEDARHEGPGEVEQRHGAQDLGAVEHRGPRPGARVRPLDQLLAYPGELAYGVVLEG